MNKPEWTNNGGESGQNKSGRPYIAASNDNMEPPISPVAGPSILLVEDNPAIALELRAALQSLYRSDVEVCTHIAEVHSLLATGPFDLALVNAELTGAEDGVEIGLTIQKDFDCPVVFFARSANSDMRHRVAESRPFGFLLYPFESLELDTVIQIALRRHSVEQDLSASEFRNRLLFELASDGILLADSHGVVQRANSRISDLTGLPKTELLGRFFWEPFEVDTESVTVDRGKVRFVETEHRPLHGEPTPVELSISILPAGLIQVLVRDLRHQRKGRQQMQLLARVFDSIVEGVFVADRRRNLVTCNRSFMAAIGYDLEEISGRNVSIFRTAQHSRGFYARLWRDLEFRGKWEGEITVRKKSGEEEAQWASLSAIRDESGKISHFVGIFIDLTERKRYEDRLYYLAHHDSLTDLPNRSLFSERLDRAILRSQRTGRRFAVFFLDLDRFKAINDTLGHDAGDRLLCDTADRLREVLRKGDTVSRYGGDEFNVLVEDIRETEDVSVVAEKIIHSMERPFSLGGKKHQISPSIGIAIYPEDGLTNEELLKAADRSMYRAKDAGGASYRFSNGRLNLRSLERELLFSGIESGLAREEFSLAYWPLLSLHDGSCIGLSMELVWNHPDLGRLGTTRFRRVIEESAWQREVCERTLAMLAQHLTDWSASHSAPNLIFPVRDNCLELGYVLHRLPGRIPEGTALSLELDERELRDYLDWAAENRAEPAIPLGIRNPGTGYLNIQELGTVPLTFLKIGSERCRHLRENPADRSMVQITAGMAHSLDVLCIADGSQSPESASLLLELGCDGYVDSRIEPAFTVAQCLEMFGPPSHGD